MSLSSPVKIQFCLSLSFNWYILFIYQVTRAQGDMSVSYIFYYCAVRSQATVHTEEPQMRGRKGQMRRKIGGQMLTVRRIFFLLLLLIFPLGFLIWWGIYQHMVSSLYSRPWTCRHMAILRYNYSLSTSEILRLVSGSHSDFQRQKKDSSPSWSNSSHQHYSTPIHLCWVLGPVLDHGAQSTRFGHCYHCF